MKERHRWQWVLSPESRGGISIESDGESTLTLSFQFAEFDFSSGEAKLVACDFPIQFGPSRWGIDENSLLGRYTSLEDFASDVISSIAPGVWYDEVDGYNKLIRLLDSCEFEY